MLTLDAIHRRIFEITFNLRLTLFFFVVLLINAPLPAQTIPDIIFTQLPVTELNKNTSANNVYSPANKYVKNCRIVSLLSSTQEPVNLTPEFYSASDPDVSFDGDYIIFSGKKEVNDFWQIWRMKVDGSEKMQITNEAGDCYMPVYAGNRFYLNDPAPTPQIIYTGTAHNWKNNIESGPVLSLYGMDITGNSVHRLTFNLYSDFSPDVLADGRIVFSSFQLPGKFAFFIVNNDGTDLMTYYGNHHEPLYKNDIHLSAVDDRSYYIEADKPDFLGGGNVAYLSQRRPLHSYKRITRTANGYYKNPCSLPNGGLLVSFRSNDADAVYSLYKLNPETGKQQQKILESPGWHSLDVQVSTSHPKVKGRSNWLIPGAVNGVFYCLNSYQTDTERDIAVNSGDFKYVRVVEGLPIENDTHHKIDTVSNISGSKFAPARILGVAPVEEDGSFHVRVPAEIPLSFQMLDENQMTIDRQNTWTWVIGNENRGCIGCHEDRELSPANKLAKALIKPPAELTASIEERRTVDFRHQIAPIIKSNCATSGCHVSSAALPNFEQTNAQLNDIEIYKTLLNPINKRTDRTYILPGFAKRSPLLWHIWGNELVTDETYNSGSISQIPSELLLSEEERLLFIEWIDLGAHWDLINIK